MSEENVESVRRITDAQNRGDRAAWLANTRPDVVMIPAREWPENAPIRGAEAIWDFYGEVGGTWEAGSFELAEIIDSGADAVAANLRRQTRGKASGVGVDFNYWVVTTHRKGKTARIEWFSNRDEALEAAGLSES
jgi:ketosteroid isomerase-like protein